MEQAKLSFRPKRSDDTRAFMQESRTMHETYPDQYSPERPYSRGSSPVKEPTGPARHVYKLMGALYRQKKERAPQPAADKVDYRT